VKVILDDGAYPTVTLRDGTVLQKCRREDCWEPIRPTFKGRRKEWCSPKCAQVVYQRQMRAESRAWRRAEGLRLLREGFAKLPPKIGPIA
jgi:hypothetical protein